MQTKFLFDHLGNWAKDGLVRFCLPLLLTTLAFGQLKSQVTLAVVNCPNSPPCSEGASFNINLNTNTMTASIPNLPSYNWTVTDAFGTITPLTGQTVPFTFLAANAPYTVVLTVPNPSDPQHPFTCCKQVVAQEPCTFTATAFVECSQLRIRVHANDGSAVNNHNWTIAYTKLCGQAFSDLQAPNTPADWTLVVWDYNSYTHPSITITLTVNGVSCTQTVLVNIPGVFIGEPCQTRTLGDLVNCAELPASQLVFPSGSFAFENLYIVGNFVVNQNYTFSNINLWMGQNSSIDVVSSDYTGGHSGGIPPTTTLTFQNGTIAATHGVISPAHIDCICAWRGIDVFNYGRFTTNPGNLYNQASNPVTIRDAIYAVHPAIGPLTIASANLNPIIRLNNTFFTKNFIGLFAIDRPYNLSRFDRNIFEGGVLKTNCDFGGLCPLVTNLQGNNEFPYKQWGYAGILQIRTDLNIQANGNQSSTTNHFRHLPMGIIMRGANATIRRSDFEDIDWTQTSGDYTINTGYGINFIDELPGNHTLRVIGLPKDPLTNNWPNTFSNVNQAIYAGSHWKNTVANITGCKMDQVRTGITVSSPDGLFPGTAGNVSSVIATGNNIRLAPPTIDQAVTQPQWLCPPNPPVLPANCGAYGIGLFDLEPTFSNFDIQINEIAMQDPNFDKTEWGIFFTNMTTTNIGTPVTAGRISNNIINLDNGFSGIEYDFGQGLVIDRNLIRLNDQVAGDFSTFGIHTNHGQAATISCNRIRNMETANAGNHFVGIFNGFTTNGVVSHNNIGDRDGDGTVGNGDPDVLMQFSNTVSASQEIGCNRFWGELSRALVYDNSNIQDQLNRRNRFLDTYVNPAALQIGTSAGKFQNSSAFQMLPPTWSPISFFKDNAGPSDTLCTCPTFFFQSPDDPSAFDKTIANGSVSNPDAFGQYLLDDYLYDKLLLNPSFVQPDPDFSVFKSQKQSQPLGQLQQAQFDIRQSFTLSNADQATVSQNEGTIANLALALGLLDSIAAENAGLTTNEWADFDSKKAQLDGLAQQNVAIYSQNLQARQAGVNALKGQVSAINATQVWETNQKSVLSVWLETMQVGQNSLTNTQLSTLTGIAAQCPEIGGKPVFWARAILASLKQDFVSGSNCATERSAAAPGEHSRIASEASVFPNPNDGNFQIKLDDNDPNTASEYQVIIFNSIGQKVKEYSLEEGVHPVTVTNHEGGFAFISIWKDNKLISSEKILIFH